MTDGDDVFSFAHQDQMIEQARQDTEKKKWLQDMVIPCQICKKIKGSHDLQPNWDGHPWCKDNLAYLSWKFKKKGIQ